jgi:hypothetical protein
MAQFIALGKLPVPTPGTPVRPTFPPTLSLHSVHAVTIVALPGNTGAVYIGVAGMNKTTLAGVLQILPIPTINALPSFQASIAEAGNGISLDQLYVDADTAGEGVLVSAIIA